MLNVTPQAVYQHRTRSQEKASRFTVIKDWVHAYRILMPRIGGRKLYWLIKPKLMAHGIKMGRDGFFDYLRAHRLLVLPKRSYTKTTLSKHWMKKHPNLTKDAPAPIRPEQTLVADITYVTSKQGIHYLSLVTDAYSRQIMGYHLSENMPAAEVVKALKMAAKRRSYTHKAIHHSDRGLQYCASEYQEVLRLNNITPSMTDGHDCYQNALAERVNGILKNEFLLYECNTISELKQLIDESVYVYNHVRPHLSLNMRTPAEVHDSYLCHV